MTSTSVGRKKLSSVLVGAAFLMATSAIGPGFITQTTLFTQQLTTNFAFVIACSVVIDVVVQLNIWRIVSVSGMRAQDLANKYFKGSGYVLSGLIVAGGLAFNIGNIAGAGLGITAMTGVDLNISVLLSTIAGILIFWYKDAGRAMDLFTKVLGFVMIVATVYIVFAANPPIGTALRHTIMPEKIDSTAILVLVGGTVGGYISFAGVHRLIDDGISGPAQLGIVSCSAVRGILIVSCMRVLLFLAALGVVASGIVLRADNPASSVFESAAGEWGKRIFGLVLWCAAITSVVGSAYTSVSFIQTFHSALERNRKWITTAFIFISMVIFLAIGRPVRILVIVGALNAFILPVALMILLVITGRLKKHMSFQQPVILQILGWIVAVALLLLSLKTVWYDLSALWH